MTKTLLTDNQAPQIVDVSGRPIKSAASFKAGSGVSHELAGWTPGLNSAATDAKEYPIMQGRARDLTKNSGYIAGAVQSAQDNIAGPQYRLNLQPNYRMLGISHEEANDWAQKVEEQFTAYAEHPECWIDAERKRTFSQMMRNVVAHDMINGEYITVRQWRPDMRTPFATCFSEVDPERICTPNDRALSNTAKIYDGVEVDKYGAAKNYYLRKSHPDDNTGRWWNYGQSDADKFQKVGKYNRFGWRQVIHMFDAKRGGQQRGESRMASTIQKIKMADRYSDVTLEAAILAATYAMVVKSDLGSDSVFDAINPQNGIKNTFAELMSTKMDYRDQGVGSKLTWNGVTIPHLFPGESLESVRSQFPNTDFSQFYDALHGEAARGLGTSREQYTGDFSKTTYASAKTSIEEMWKAVTGKRASIVDKVATLKFGLWLDEGVSRGIIPLPNGVTDYYANRAALTSCRWIAQGKGAIDPLKNAKANEVMLRTGETTLRKIAAESGDDWQSNLDQTAREVKAKIKHIESMGIRLTDEQKAGMFGLGTSSGESLVFGAEE